MKKYFLVKAKVEALTEKGKVKIITEQYLQAAEDVKEAESNFRKETESTLGLCEIASISETKILDVFESE